MDLAPKGGEDDVVAQKLAEQIVGDEKPAPGVFLLDETFLSPPKELVLGDVNAMHGRYGCRTRGAVETGE